MEVPLLQILPADLVAHIAKFQDPTPPVYHDAVEEFFKRHESKFEIFYIVFAVVYFGIFVWFSKDINFMMFGVDEVDLFDVVRDIAKCWQRYDDGLEPYRNLSHNVK